MALTVFGRNHILEYWNILFPVSAILADGNCYIFKESQSVIPIIAHGKLILFTLEKESMGLTVLDRNHIFWYCNFVLLE